MKLLKKSMALLMAVLLTISTSIYSPAIVYAAHGNTWNVTMSIKLDEVAAGNGLGTAAGTVSIDSTEVKDENVVTLTEGTPSELVVSVNSGYRIKDITIDGEAEILTDTEKTSGYTKPDIDATADMNIEVEFETVYTVTVSFDSNGAVVVDGEEYAGDVKVVKGANTSIVATPNANYEVSSITDAIGTNAAVDVLASASIDASGVATYTITGIADNHNVAITFSKIKYKYSYTIGAGGSVKNSSDVAISTGDVDVEIGTSHSITITPNAGYELKTFTVDGVAESLVEDEANGKYTYAFAAADSNKTIVIEFEQAAVAVDNADDYITIEYFDSSSNPLASALKEYTDENGYKVVFLPENAKVKFTAKDFNGYSYFKDSTGKISSTYATTKTITISGNKTIENLLFRKSKLDRNTQTVTLKYKFQLDKTAPSVETFAAVAERDYFYEDFDVQVKVKDDGVGLNSVEYWITDDSAGTHATEGTSAAPLAVTGATPLTAGAAEFEGRITVPVTATKNNTNYVKVHLKVTDTSGNTDTQTHTFHVSTVSPEISLSFNDTVANELTKNSKTYGAYGTDRIGTLTIKEVDYMMDRTHIEGALANVIKKDGVLLSTTPIVQTAIINYSGVTGDPKDAEGRSTYTITLNFAYEGQYDLDLDALRNIAGNTFTKNITSTQYPENFFVDKNAPTVKIEKESNPFMSLLSTITFGFCKNNVTVTVENSIDSNPNLVPSENNNGSGIKKVSYYKVNYTDNYNSTNKAYDDKDEITASALSTLYGNGEFTDLPAGQYSVTVADNEVWSVYFRLEDYAGNETYASSEGVITDVQPLEITLTPPAANANGFYNNDLYVSFEVTENEVNHALSGIESVEYKVWKYSADVNPDLLAASKITETPTVLSGFTAGDVSYTGNILIDAASFDSNYVALTVKATDRAGNEAIKTIRLKIDTTRPTINISYDNNSPDSGKYYRSNRTATIVVTERNFNANDVVASITNTDGSVPSLSSWRVAGTGNDTKHTATITYSADGDYTFDISYTDLAGNACVSKNFDRDTENASVFTIDKTDPEVSISFDNNSSQNDKYFKANRTATITVDEHNFDEDRVNVIITGSLSGNAIATPGVNWSNSGDTHTGTVNFNSDGDYSIEVTLTDLAGNNGNSVSRQEFTVDTKIDKPKINGVENGKSYKDEVNPVIDFSDPNYKSHEISVKRTRANRLNEDVTAEFMAGASESSNGFTRNANKLEKKLENDGIYTIEVKVLDMAGNEETETVTFTVNRFGSVYVFNEYLVGLQDKYINEIKENLVISEYNADRLVEGSVKVEITRDGDPLQNVIYDVNPAVNNTVAVGQSGWYQYDYTISAENFKEDGVYKINVSSEDAAGNKPENANYDENNILFRYDTTAPEITSITGLDEKIINATSVNVSLEMFDSIGLDKITVYNNDAVVKDFENFDDIINFKGDFEIGAGSNQHIKVVAKDKAGNEFDTDSKDSSGEYTFTPSYKFERDVTVSTDFFVRLFANPGAVAAVAGGVVVVGGGGAAGAIMFRKRRIKIK